MVMTATVTLVQKESLLVIDLSNNQEVLVHFSNPNWFLVGDTIEITFDGKMTISIPPQISAHTIQLITPAPPPFVPAETRAIVNRIDRDFLIVRDFQNNRQLRVNYAYPHHFCVGQRVTITYDTIVMNELPTINAIDITPIC